MSRTASVWVSRGDEKKITLVVKETREGLRDLPAHYSYQSPDHEATGVLPCLVQGQAGR